MSRSYKKNPISKDNPRGSHQNKKIVSRMTRRRLKEGEPASHNSYKKLRTPWLIHDYTLRWTKEEAIKDYYDWIKTDDRFFKKYPTVEEFLNKYWYNIMRRK